MKRVVLGMAVCAVVIGLASPAPALSAPRRTPSQPVKIISPGRDSLQLKRSVRVAVRVARGATISGVMLDGRRLHLARHGLHRVATVRRSRLRRGLNTLEFHQHVRGQGSLHRWVHFTRPRRLRPGLLKVRAEGGTGPLRITARVADPDAKLRAWLNGRRVHQLFDHSVKLRHASLSPADGLRYGRNVLRILAFLPDGKFASAKVVRFRSPTAPLAAAGTDRSLPVGHRIRFDGSRSLAAHPGDPLTWSWRVVRRPQGSHALLKRIHQPRPVLRPDVPGTYKVALTSGESGAHAAAASAGHPTAGSGTDVVTMTVQPDYGPAGVSIDTYDTFSGSPAIDVGGTPYTEFPAQGGYQVLALDRGGPQGGTLEEQLDQGFAFGTEDLIPLALANVDKTDIVIITATPGGSGANISALNTVLASIGGTPVTDVSAGFSIVGIPGQDPGQAYQYDSSAASRPGFSGIAGLLAKDTSSPAPGSADYVLTPTDYIPFSIGGAGDPMTFGCVSGDPCTSIPTPPISEGFVVTLIDEHSLTLAGGPVTFADSDSSMAAMATYLEGAAGLPYLVVVKSVGRPTPSGPGWFQASRGISALGGNPQTFNTFNAPNAQGTADYQLIGSGDGYAATDASGVAPVLSGILTRDSDWRLAPAASDQTGTTDYSLAEIAYQPAYKWQSDPAWNFPYQGGPYAAAEADIAQEVFCPPNPNRTAPCHAPSSIRAAYWQYGASQYWDPALLTGLHPMSGGGYTAQQFTQLVSQLRQEWAMVDEVNALANNLVSPAVAASGQQQTQVADITDAISNVINPPQSGVTSAQIITIFAGAASALGAVLAPEAVAPIAAAVLGAVGGGMSIAAAFTTDGNGNRLLSRLNTTSDQVATDLASAVAASEIGAERLREILVSDWGKLQDASGLQVSSLAKADDASSLSIGNDLFQLTARRQAYHSLLPVVATAASSGFSGDTLGSAGLECVTGMSLSGSTVQVSTDLMLMGISSSKWFTSTTTDPIFGPADFNAGDSGAVLTTGEQPSDFWVSLWPAVGTGPCR
jgi:hypothetical protein